MSKVRGFLATVAVALVLALVGAPVTTFAVEVNTDMGYSGATLPAGPDMSGNVVDVSPDNAQYVLDGAYGSIDGKTINFTAGTYDNVLVLARPTKYSGSNTEYYNTTEGNKVSLDQLTSAVPTYRRTVQNVTLTADKDVVLPGFSASSGHVYGSAESTTYDYVRDQTVDSTNNSYYSFCTLNNITFKGLTISGQVYFADYASIENNVTSLNSGIKFEECSFQGNPGKMSDSTYAAIRMGADSKYFTNVSVLNCSISNYFQGIYIQGVNGITVKNNHIDHTTHNAIALQSSTNNPAMGEAVIAENYIENVWDRAIRVGNSTDNLQLKVNNNVMLNAGDEAGQLFKADTLPTTEGSVSLENNYWCGDAVRRAVSNENVRPSVTGITGGTFSQPIRSRYLADGYSLAVDVNGNQTVAEGKAFQIGEAKYDSLEEALEHAEAGATITVLKDAATEPVNIVKGVTLELGGHTLSIVEDGSTSSGLYFTAGESIVRNGTIVDTRSNGSTTCGYIAVRATGGGTTLTTEGLSVKSYVPDSKANYNYMLRVDGGASLELNAGTSVSEIVPAGMTPVFDENTYGTVGVAVLGTSPTQTTDIDESAATKLIVNDGVTIETMSFAISGNGSDSNNTLITINGGSITSTSAQGIYHPQYGRLTVNGGTVTGDSGIEMRSGELAVNGGTIEGTGTPVKIEPNGNGSTSTGAGIAVAQHTTKLPIKVTVKDGTITGYSALYEATPENDPATEKIELSITGGSFEATGDGADAVYSETYNANEKGFVSGGSFSTNPIKYVVNNSVVKIDSEDSFTALERKNLPAGTYVVPDGAKPLTSKDFESGLVVTIDPVTGQATATRPQAPSQGEHAVKVEQAEGGKVVVAPTTADEGDEVTITATPDKGQEVRSVAVTTKDGKEVKVSEGDKANTWTFEMPDAEVTVKVVFGCDSGELCPTHKFDDVLADAWYHDAVDWAVEEGLLSGYEDGKLGPDGTLSRAQLATVLWRQAGEPEATSEASFADCDPEAFYAEAVAWADESGIIEGYGDGTNFGPEDPVTREQLATILWRQAGEPDGKGDLSDYPDGDEATDYAVPALEWAVDTGVLSGFGDGTLAPGGVLSRAMLAAMLQRMAE